MSIRMIPVAEYTYEKQVTRPKVRIVLILSLDLDTAESPCRIDDIGVSDSLSVGSFLIEARVFLSVCNMEEQHNDGTDTHSHSFLKSPSICSCT